jgi:hypothetical protein
VEFQPSKDIFFILGLQLLSSFVFSPIPWHEPRVMEMRCAIKLWDSQLLPIDENNPIL